MLNPTQWPELVLRGTSAPAQRLRLQVERVAPHFRTAMLVGEAGCLKEQVARALHARSPLRDDAFVVCRAAELTHDLLYRDAVATVFIAGVGGLGGEQQSLLLARLRPAGRGQRPELRMIFSSEASARGLVAAGRLDSELHGCVSAVEIRVPPLRERLDDLPEVLEGADLHPEALARLREHGWPGNFQELRQVLAVAVAAARGEGGTVGVEHLPTFAGAARAEVECVRLESVLRRHVVAVLEGCAGNKLRAAEMLGISRSTLYRMLDAG